MNFKEWLNKNVPQVGGCLLAMDDTIPDEMEYYLVERKKDSIGNSFFLVNGNFHWDMECLFNENWKIVYKKVV